VWSRFTIRRPMSRVSAADLDFPNNRPNRVDRSRGPARGQAGVARSGDGGSAVSNAEFDKDVRNVVTDRLLAEPELFGNEGASPSGGDEIEDVTLARRQGWKLEMDAQRMLARPGRHQLTPTGMSAPKP
jgi:hypothetical protein